MNSPRGRRTASLQARAAGVVLALILLSLQPAAARAHCLFPDLPDCACYTGYPSWPLVPIAGDVIGTARLSHFSPALSILTRCRRPGVQPYWQLQLPETSPTSAARVDHFFPFTPISAPPRAWCTETVAFWHRPAGVPYVNGYGTPGPFLFWNHHPSSYVTDTDEMRTWYKV